ncbi:class III chitinase, putative [Cordyceps militaris CM01]|uniref:chitinase n=1 Tax=Cordyceps militaris (strain CM01) TaxID=983644 RepID=G3JGX4_CORMM|nr:class III chitinase, putative [Cordyceps militaris CM01]EGX91530.1 class III chitinase, putative [Cordyceps militaris CM01]
MASLMSMATLASVLAVLPSAMAGFNPASGKNIAVYWGQNSYNQGSGPLAQQRLAYYCKNTDLAIIPVAFMNGITPPITNFANAGDNCTAFPGNTNVLNCPQIEEDIKTCQSTYGKTIVLSLGGATYSQGGWSSTTAAQNAAQMVWDMFGPVQSGKVVDRPFGGAVVDGFDFDFESSANNLPAFGAKLRSLMDGAGGKKFYLTAAPQCVFPDAAVGAVLDAVAFDFVMIQFYNNWCGVSNFQEGASTQNAFNMDVWDKWARASKNPNVKLLLGIPAAQGAGGGYTAGSKLKAAINYSQKYSSFGGVMMWDMSQLYSNSAFLSEVLADLAGGPTPTTVPPGTTAPPSTTTTPTSPGSTTPPTSTSSPPPSGGGLDQYAQCGGIGYSGPTVCKAPYTCVKQGDWWSSCK